MLFLVDNMLLQVHTDYMPLQGQLISEQSKFEGAYCEWVVGLLI